jgi:hypothetical protein
MSLLCIDSSILVWGGLGIAGAALIHLVEPGLWQWVKRGGPDYLDEPDEEEGTEVIMDESVEVDPPPFFRIG